MVDNKKIASATSWSMFAEVIAKLIAPITNMILARILMPEAFGAVATITMIISFADVFTDAGFQKYIVQHEFSDKDDYYKSVNVAFWSNLLLSVTTVLIICIFRNRLALLVGSPDLGAGISAASLSIILSSFSSIQMAVYKRDFDFKTLFAVRITTSFIPIIITVPLAMFFKNYWALVIGTLTMNFVQSIMLTVRSEWKPKMYYSFEKFKEMFSFTAWTLLESITIWLTSYIGTFIVGRILNDYYLGIYKTSMSTVNSYMGIITAGILPVLFSALSRYQNDDERFKKTYFKFQSLVADLIMPMGVGLYLFRELATRILLGENWGEAADFIGLWSLMSSITIVYSFFASEVYRSKGKPNVSLITHLLHLIVLIPAIAISAKYGYKPLYITRSLVRFQAIAISLIVMSYIFNIGFIESLKNTFAQIFSSTAMGVFAYFVKEIYPHNVLWQFITIVISAAVYFGVLMCFKKQRKEVLNVAIPVLERVKRTLLKKSDTAD